MTPGGGCSLLPRHCLLAVFSPGEQQQRTKIDGRSRKLSKSFLMRIPKVLPVTFIMYLYHVVYTPTYKIWRHTNTQTIAVTHLLPITPDVLVLVQIYT